MTHCLKSGDFLLISSDGLFDNLYEDEIALLVDKHMKSLPSVSSSSSLSVFIHPVQNRGNNDIDDDDHDELKPINSSTCSSNKTVNNHVTSDLLSSACELLVERASLGNFNFFCN